MHTELSIQKALIPNLVAKNRKYITTNTTAICGESDVLCIDPKTDYLYEYEIKISRSDFHADMEKARTGMLLGRVEKYIANHFFYIVPEDLITKEEVPEYAGLIYVLNEQKKVKVGFGRNSKVICNKIKTIKRAPLLHKNKVRRGVLDSITQSLFYKMWNQLKAA